MIPVPSVRLTIHYHQENVGVPNNPWYSDLRGNNKWEAGEIMSGGEEVIGGA